MGLDSHFFAFLGFKEGDEAAVLSCVTAPL